MAKFNLYAHDSSVTDRPAFRQSSAAVGSMSAKYFAAGLGLWFVLMFGIGYLILTA
jgi:hypothetical protein